MGLDGGLFEAVFSLDDGLLEAVLGLETGFTRDVMPLLRLGLKESPDLEAGTT